MRMASRSYLKKQKRKEGLRDRQFAQRVDAETQFRAIQTTMSFFLNQHRMRLYLYPFLNIQAGYVWRISQIGIVSSFSFKIGIGVSLCSIEMLMLSPHSTRLNPLCLLILTPLSYISPLYLPSLTPLQDWLL